MKAYRVIYQGQFFPYGPSEDVVFANTRKRAKSKFLANKSVFCGAKECEDNETIELYRLKELDNCEKLSLMKITEKLIYDVSKSDLVSKIGEKEFNKSNSDKVEFERAWIKRYGSKEKGAQK